MPENSPLEKLGFYGLLEKIRSVGHWRVNFRPTELPTGKLSFGEAETAISATKPTIEQKKAA